MKNKFNEKDVPSWCKWIAIDENGECWAFESMPKKTEFGWWHKRNAKAKTNERLYEGNPPKNWKDELYTWS